jgi:Arc/MetJ-type ribon-helix-helix transcriptional regulator
MKERASFTFDKETIDLLDNLLESGEFRNRSHIVEHAIKLLGSEEFNQRKEIKQIKKYLTA